MTHFERVAAALAHQETDRVPVYPILSGCNRRLVNASYPEWSQSAEICAESYLRAAEQFDLDCVVTLIDLSVECDLWGQELIFPENEAAHPNYKNNVVKEIEDYALIKEKDYREGRRMMMHVDVVRRIAEKLKGQVPIVAFVFGPLGTLSMLRGQEKLYMDIYDDMEAVQEATWNVARSLKGYAGALIDAGADAIMWDTLFSSGSIMRKQMWVDLEAEPIRELADYVRGRGCMNMIHNCGNKIYFDAQIEAIQPAAISFLYPPDDCANFAECKAKYGDKTTLIGCVPPTNAVVGSDEDWDRLCREQIEVMGKGGGFMLATGCEYPANAPFDRAYRMVDIARTYTRA